MNPADPHSYSQTQLCVLTKLHLNWRIDFERKVISGVVTLHYDNRKADNNVLVLDTKALTIQRVYEQESGQDLLYKLHDDHQYYGTRLGVNLPRSGIHSHSLCIQYETTAGCTALGWLTAKQTLGKQHPYMFSQGQPTHVRSMVPCQDTPLVKCPYSARVEAPAPLEVLMSAIKDENVMSSAGGRVHTFHQNIATPSYLIAIVCARIESRDISPRVRVWSEQEMVDEAAKEFEDTETMLKTAEDLLGPYVWGRYDMLVLPPSFPYGGMENPCLSFLTPTLLAKDKSLANVVAHELTHSWTGNMVTNTNWEHFWLNEGFTVFVERKILGRMYGQPYRHFAAIGGFSALKEEVDRQGSTNPFTQLVTRLEGHDPDEAYNRVPYEKGSAFLFYLEQKLGGPELFEPYFREYLNRFQYKSITTDDWKDHLFTYFDGKVDKSVVESIDWDTWLYEPGMPPDTPTFDTSLADSCSKLATRWLNADDKSLDGSFSAADMASFTSEQKEAVLVELLEKEPLSLKKIRKMEELYNMSKTFNSEIKMRWIRLCIKARDESIIDKALEFVNAIGRMTLIRPVYRDLYAWDKTKEMTVSNFKTGRDNLHAIAAGMVDKDLELV